MSKSPLIATTPLACQISGNHPDRLNEAIHTGIFPCAPRTKAGKRREFGVNDIIVLTLFRRFLDEGMSAAAAGAKACEVLGFLHKSPDADRVFIVKPSMGGPDFLPEFDFNKNYARYLGPAAPDVQSVEIINLTVLRDRVTDQVKAAQG